MPGSYEVLLTAGAESDLESIHDFVLTQDGTHRADYLLNSVLRTIEDLSEFPERGSYPKELLDVGIKTYRQTFFKPYRVIYQVIGHRVIVSLIADGRRDMQSILSSRLLRR